MGGYFTQWMMLYGSFILLWVYGFAMYFWLGSRQKKAREARGEGKK